MSRNTKLIRNPDFQSTICHADAILTLLPGLLILFRRQFDLRCIPIRIRGFEVLSMRRISVQAISLVAPQITIIRELGVLSRTVDISFGGCLGGDQFVSMIEGNIGTMRDRLRNDSLRQISPAQSDGGRVATCRCLDGTDQTIRVLGFLNAIDFERHRHS